MKNRIFAVLSVIVAVALILPWLLTTNPEVALGAAPSKLRQEVNITDAYMYAPSGSYATSSEIVGITDNNYTSPSYYFEVVASTTGATTGTIKLVNATSSATVATITMTGGQTSYARLRSTQFVPNASTTVEYKVVLGNESIGKGIIASRIVVLQSNATISNTETQIEIGSATTSASNTTSLPLQSPKYWYYDSTKWDASPTFYAEVTYKTNPVASSTLYSTATTTTSSLTYIGSTGVGYVVAEGWGGGGGGDGVTSAATIGGGGGAGGAYARATTTVTAGSSNTISVGKGGNEDNNGVASSLTTTAGVVMSAEGGLGATTGTGAVASAAASIGGVKFAGGSGGNGETTVDTGGAGGGSGGPDGAGITPSNAGNGVPVAGGNGDNNLGGAGGAAGTGADDTCDTENGKAGVNNILGGGGGGGGDGDVSSICTGGAGGKPGGGGGGSDEGTGTDLVEVGGPGQVKITEYIGTVGVALQMSDGTGDNFAGWTTVSQIMLAGKTSTTSERIRSASFSPTSGRNYRIVASTTSATASYDVYNAKIVVSSGGTVVDDSYSETNDGGNSDTLCSDCVNDADGQSFSGNSGTLQTAQFFIFKAGSPTGNVFAKIYASTGTSGTDATPTGSALATSDGLDSSTLTTGLVLRTFTFSGANKITLTNGTTYIVSIEFNGTAQAVGSVHTSRDVSSPTHVGNYSFRATSGGTWTGDATKDAIFYVNTQVSPTLLEPQYLLYPNLVPTGTALQKGLTSWDSSEWAGSTNAYYAEANAANASASVVEFDTAAGTAITNGTVSSPDNRGRSTALCMPATGDLDFKVTTNNNDIFAVRIIVGVGDTTSPVCGAVPVIYVPRVLLLQGQTVVRNGKTVIPPN